MIAEEDLLGRFEKISIQFGEAPSATQTKEDSKYLGELFGRAETVYEKRMKAKPFKFEPKKMEFTFWEEVSFAIRECLEDASEADTKQKKEHRKISRSHFQYYAETLISELKKINLIEKLCRKYDCFYVEHLNQANDPKFSSESPCCVGIFFRWAQKIYAHPPTKEALENAHLSFEKYQGFLKTLRQEKFPDKFYAQYTSKGAVCIDDHTLLYQKHIKAITKELGRPDNHSNPSEEYSGRALGSAILTFLNDQEAIQGSPIVVSATLNYKDAVRRSAHVLGFARIQQGSTAYYRFCDSNGGEFQTTSCEKFPMWLEDYFKIQGYHTRYSGFSFQRVDGILPKLNSMMEALKVKEARPVQIRPLTPLPSLTSLLLAPFVVLQDSFPDSQPLFPSLTDPKQPSLSPSRLVRSNSDPGSPSKKILSQLASFKRNPGKHF